LLDDLGNVDGPMQETHGEHRHRVSGNHDSTHQ
jgi:hypothetical protein